MRVFLGIDLPADIKGHISRYLTPLKISDRGWESPHDYHQTLLFIGEVSETEIGEISGRMESIRFKSFFLQLKEFAFFNRRIMYLSFQPSKELFELKQQINKIFKEWVRPEEKPFLPHVTVKRWQRYEYDELFRGLKQSSFEPKTFLVSSVCLFKSEKDSANRKYHVIKEVYLGH